MTIILAIPALNEEALIRSTVETTVRFITKNFSDDNFRIVVVDNNSTDRTEEICQELVNENTGLVFFQKTDRQGKGIAIRDAWTKHNGDMYIFFDADLATDLKSLPLLIDACRKNGIAVGSRYLPNSEVKKTMLRHIFSWGYRLVLKIVLNTKIKDLPCGFKAVSSDVIREILPLVKNNTWFFDTELTIRAERAGYSIKEVPVRWHNINQKDRPSRVSLIKVATEYLKCSWALRKELKQEK